MFYPDYFQPIADVEQQLQQLRDRTDQTWQHWQPRLTAVGIALAGMLSIAIAATIESGQKTRDGWEWIAPRLKAAYRAFTEYQDKPAPAPAPMRFEEENANYLPNPYEAVERELLETLGVI